MLYQMLLVSVTHVENKYQTEAKPKIKNTEKRTVLSFLASSLQNLKFVEFLDEVMSLSLKFDLNLMTEV